MVAKALTEKKGFGIRFLISLVFLLAGLYSILQLLGIYIPVEVPKEILLWITSVGCLLFGLFFMFKKKK